MITTIFLITLAVFALVKVNKDTVKSKGTILILLGSITLAQFFDHRTYEAKIDVLRERINQLEKEVKIDDK